MKMMIPRVRSNPADEGFLDAPSVTEGGTPNVLDEVEVVEVAPLPKIKRKKGKNLPAWGGSPMGPAGTTLVIGLAVGAVALAYFGLPGGFSKEKAIKMVRAHIASPKSRKEPWGLSLSPLSSYDAWGKTKPGKTAFTATTTDNGQTYRVKAAHPIMPLVFVVDKHGVRFAGPHFSF